MYPSVRVVLNRYMLLICTGTLTYLGISHFQYQTVYTDKWIKLFADYTSGTKKNPKYNRTKLEKVVLLNVCTCVRAEHSTYFTALRSLASLSPLSGDSGRCLFLASFSTVLLSSLRSTWVPTSRNGVRGQWWEISGTHWRRERTDIYEREGGGGGELNVWGREVVYMKNGSWKM